MLEHLKDHIEEAASSMVVEDASVEGPKKGRSYWDWDIVEVASAETMA